MTGARFIAAVLFACTSLGATQGTTTAARTDQLIAELGSFEFSTRMSAARSLRRLPVADVSAALERAARAHADEYARFRALVILAGMDGRVASGVMRDLMSDRNDRIRTLVFQWFEHHPEPDVLPRLVEAFPKELSEFVRPALTRAIAAQGTDPRAQAVLGPLVMRGEDFFRGAVIDALGDYKGTYAKDAVVAVARQEGPLQDDAITALGKMGDTSVRTVLAELQASGPQEVQPTVSSALCLLGIDCEARLAYLMKTLEFSAGREGYQPLLRAVVHAVGMLAARGNAAAFNALLDAGVVSRDPARAAIALGTGLVALRNPRLLLDVLEKRKDADAVIALLIESFDMLSEDFEEERFYVEIRQAYWTAAAGSSRRALSEQLIEKLEF